MVSERSHERELAVVVVVVVMLVSVGAIAGVATICSGRQAGRVKQCVTSAARAVVWLALLYVCSMALVRRHGRDRAVESRARDAQ